MQQFSYNYQTWSPLKRPLRLLCIIWNTLHNGRKWVSRFHTTNFIWNYYIITKKWASNFRNRKVLQFQNPHSFWNRTFYPGLFCIWHNYYVLKLIVYKNKVNPPMYWHKKFAQSCPGACWPEIRGRFVQIFCDTRRLWVILIKTSFSKYIIKNALGQWAPQNMLWISFLKSLWKPKAHFFNPVPQKCNITPPQPFFEFLWMLVTENGRGA